MPNDISGVSIFNPGTREFEVKPGPLFANIVVVDEINRAAPRTQSALLEAMAENRVTIDNTTYPPPRHITWLTAPTPPPGWRRCCGHCVPQAPARDGGGH